MQRNDGGIIRVTDLPGRLHRLRIAVVEGVQQRHVPWLDTQGNEDGFQIPPVYQSGAQVRLRIEPTRLIQPPCLDGADRFSGMRDQSRARICHAQNIWSGIQSDINPLWAVLKIPASSIIGGVIAADKGHNLRTGDEIAPATLSGIASLVDVPLPAFVQREPAVYRGDVGPFGKCLFNGQIHNGSR